MSSDSWLAPKQQRLIPRYRRSVTRFPQACGAVLVALTALGTSLAAVSDAASLTAGATITINPAQDYQSIAGFGVSEGFGQAKTLMSAPASAQNQVLSLLYSPTSGAGLTILRNEISADAGFTIEPNAPTSPNAEAVVSDASRCRPGPRPAVVRKADQGRLWRQRYLCRRVERSGLHEDQRLTVPPRHGVRRPGRELQER